MHENKDSCRLKQLAKIMEENILLKEENERLRQQVLTLLADKTFFVERERRDG